MMAIQYIQFMVEILTLDIQTYQTHQVHGLGIQLSVVEKHHSICLDFNIEMRFVSVHIHFHLLAFQMILIWQKIWYFRNIVDDGKTHDGLERTIIQLKMAIIDIRGGMFEWMMMKYEMMRHNIGSWCKSIDDERV